MTTVLGGKNNDLFLSFSNLQIFLLTMVWGEFVFPVEKRSFFKNIP
ncbi:MAG: hypothetical protein JWN83_513 [Chitinophagaceae bacterium]|nr:hypothetical protein [Chitinophagaceae bacterium]